MTTGEHETPQWMDKAREFVAEGMDNIKKPEATVKNVDLQDVVTDSVPYKAHVNVSNPYSSIIHISDITYTFKTAGRVIAEGTIPDAGSLKADDETMVDVGIKVPHSVLVSLGKDTGADSDIDYELEIVLTVDLPVFGNFKIPGNSKGAIKLPKLSDGLGS